MNMDTFFYFLDLIIHIDKSLGIFIDQYGAWVYVALFLIIFCETGFVVFPFLPGDSLLFIAGAFAATGALSAPLLIILLLIAAITGNTINYYIGAYIGPKVFESNWRFLDRQALEKTHHFYLRHGGKTIVLARFVPIVRTFAPFIAGVSNMNPYRFQFFNVLGAIIWVAGLVIAGYFFGNLPFVKEYLNVIVLVGISAAIVPLLLGAMWKVFQQWKTKKADK